MKELFQKLDCNDLSLAWYTWNDDIRMLLHENALELSLLHTDVINLNPNEKYQATYYVRNQERISSSLAETVDELVLRLRLLTPENGIFLLKGLVDKQFGTKSIHSLFAMISEKLRNDSTCNAGSFHSPIVTKKKDSGFPVHADLFRVKGILNVITSKQRKSGGDIVLISSADLIEIMKGINIPTEVIDLFSEVLEKKPSKDLFDEFYGFMYGENEWKHSLSREIYSRQIKITSEAGIGYFIIDGQWMHGRTAVKGCVEEDRLQRLVFDTYETEKLPLFQQSNYHSTSLESQQTLKSKSAWQKSKAAHLSSIAPNKAKQWSATA